MKYENNNMYKPYSKIIFLAILKYNPIIIMMDNNDTSWNIEPIITLNKAIIRTSFQPISYKLLILFSFLFIWRIIINPPRINNETIFTILASKNFVITSP